MNGRSIILVQCGSQKRHHRCPASMMYTGNYHRVLMRYALARAPRSNVFILSAKYGLVALDDWIDPYNITFGKPGAISTEELCQQVARRGLGESHVMILGGARYANICRAIWPEVAAPLVGQGGIGKQIQLVGRWLEAVR